MTASPRPLRVSAVLLAAGAASRMGHRPKSLIELDGVALVRRLADALMQVGVYESVVVLGHYAQAIESALAGASVRCVLNPRPDEGQISSLRVGLQSVSDQSEAVMVLLSDQPLIAAPQLQHLIDAYLRRPPGVEVLQPQVEGLPGNPVLFSQRVRQEILAQGPQVGCRQWQAAHPDKVQAWVSTDRSYRIDLDTAEDLAAMQQELGSSLAWPTSSQLEH